MEHRSGGHDQEHRDDGLKDLRDHGGKPPG